LPYQFQLSFRRVAPGETNLQNASTIAIGDVHGELKALLMILLANHLADPATGDGSTGSAPAEGSSVGPIGSGAGIKNEPSGNPERFSRRGVLRARSAFPSASKYPF
jgi:hypothetical protein